MESIKLYKNEAEYQSNSITLPTTHVALCKDEGTVMYGDKKKVVDYITEEEYGSAVFNVFRAQGWIPQDATTMNVYQASLVKNLGTAFANNTEITDITFLRYFSGLTVLNINTSFSGCTNIERAVIPRTITSGADFSSTTKMKYIELLEGVTSCWSLLRDSGDSTSGCLVKFPSTLTAIYDYCFYRIRGENGIIDLRHTKVSSIGSSFMYYCLWTSEIYMPTTLKSIGNEFVSKVNSTLKYVQFDSEESISIGTNCLSKDPYNYMTSVTINFKNDIPITIGNTFGYSAKGTCVVIFHSTTLPTIGTNFFYTSRGTTKIYVPDEMVEDYKGIANLANFVNRIYPLSEYDGEYADRV